MSGSIQEVTGFLQSTLKEADALHAKNRVLESQIESKKKDFAELQVQVDVLNEKKKTIQFETMKERQDVLNNIAKRDEDSKRILSLHTNEYEKMTKNRANLEHEIGEQKKKSDKLKKEQDGNLAMFSLVDNFVKEWSNLRK